MDELAVVGQTDLREYLHILSRRKLVITLTVLVALGLAVAYSVVKTPIFSASATVLVPQQQASSALNIQNAQLQSPQALQRSLADEQQFATGDAVKRAIRQALGYEAAVGISTSASSDVLIFTAHSANKTAAATIANAYAKAYISARRADQVAQYTQQVTALEASIAQLEAKANALAATDPQRTALQQSISALTQTVQQTQAASQVASQVGPTVVNAAEVPSAPTSPKPVRNGLLGLFVGLVLGIGLAFLVERLDDGINSRDDTERAVEGVPLVGLIPMVDSWRAKGGHHLALVEDPRSNASEAYRTLRTAIQFLGIDEPKRVIGITSSVPGEGKTTAVANLAISFAWAGQRVIVVSCDLRRPRIHEFFGVDNDTGLTSLLIGQSTLSEAIRPVRDEPRLRVMPSGPVPPNPAEILSLDRVREVIDVLAENADVVLLDCPPVLPVTDALLLSRLTDGMLLVASAKSTSRRDLHRTAELLHQVRAPLLGTILNRVPVDGAYAYGYGYGYYEGHHDLEGPNELSKVDRLVARSGASNGSLRTRDSRLRESERSATNGARSGTRAERAPAADGAFGVPHGFGANLSDAEHNGTPVTGRPLMDASSLSHPPEINSPWDVPPAFDPDARAD
jgi:capsular exopolysaccharide synthesis family protein